MWQSSSWITYTLYRHSGSYLLLCDPGINHRQPLLIVASSRAIHTPITLPRGSVYRNVASWCGVTKKHMRICYGYNLKWYKCIQTTSSKLKVSLYFVSKVPVFPVIFKVDFSNSSPGFLRVFWCFSLDIFWFVTHFQSSLLPDFRFFFFFVFLFS